MSLWVQLLGLDWQDGWRDSEPFEHRVEQAPVGVEPAGPDLEELDRCPSPDQPDRRAAHAEPPPPGRAVRAEARRREASRRRQPHRRSGQASSAHPPAGCPHALRRTLRTQEWSDVRCTHRGRSSSVACDHGWWASTLGARTSRNNRPGSDYLAGIGSDSARIPEALRDRRIGARGLARRFDGVRASIYNRKTITCLGFDGASHARPAAPALPRSSLCRSCCWRRTPPGSTRIRRLWTDGCTSGDSSTLERTWKPMPERITEPGCRGFFRELRRIGSSTRLSPTSCYISPCITSRSWPCMRR